MIALIITVCALADPNACREERVPVMSQISERQCANSAPPFIAQWIGEHPQYSVVRWRCEAPGSPKKTELHFVPA